MEAQKRPVVRRDYYFDEAMNVATDYLQALTVPATAAAAVPRSAEVVRPAEQPPRAAVPALP
jgi:hypothetical protein